MPVHTVTINAAGVVKHSYRKSQPCMAWPQWSVRSYAAVAELPEEIKYRMAMLDAARGNDGRANLKPLGTTRLRKDGGTHYEMYIPENMTWNPAP